MTDLLPWPSFSGNAVWALVLMLGYPTVAIGLIEASRALGARNEFTSDILRQLAYLLLPTGAAWLILRVLAELPPDNWAVRTVETAFALTSLYLLLRLAQAGLMRLLDEQMSAPKLLLDILRIGLSLVWGAVAVSRIWDVDLASLFAAVGVGSIVLGFALQEFLGNLLSGLGLLSAHKFGIGDWIVIDGKAARVVEMDWRTVTLVNNDGSRLVVANSTLAKGNLVIAARSNDPAAITIPLTFGVDIPPELVREAVLEAGGALPGMVGAGSVKCRVTAISDTAINYAAVLPVANPGILSGPRDEFLSRFWYVAQRRGLRLQIGPAPDGAAAPDAQSRLRMLTTAGVFHGDADVLSQLAQASAFRRYRRGDLVMSAGAVAPDAVLVLAGELAVSVPNTGVEARLELVGSGQLFVLHEILAGGSCPVRVVAEADADVLAIPAAALADVMERNRVILRDVNALAEARRLAIKPLNRGLRTAA